MKTNPEKHCASLSCPERFSKCCYSISEVVSGEKGAGFFACSMCHKKFVGFPCTAGEKTRNDGELKQIIADIANEVRRLRAWRSNDIKGEDEAEFWFDRLIEKLNNL